LGVREEGKQATRQRVLAAARDLFEEIGFEEATIRMIAQRAAVSVGSVFTTFTGKTEILSHVMNDRLAGMYAELDQVAPHLRGHTVDRLRSIMAVHYSIEMRRQRLFVAYVSASFSWSADQTVIPLGQNVRFKGMLADALLEGVARGEVREGVDVDMFIEVLLAAYIWNYRLIPRESADAARLIDLMDRQIGILFEGVTAR
jgi:TetR/AcrR family transcriptional regulator, cholesterol catabolism regulator